MKKHSIFRELKSSGWLNMRCFRETWIYNLRCGLDQIMKGRVDHAKNFKYIIKTVRSH